jgi:hypothetical protein
MLTKNKSKVPREIQDLEPDFKRLRDLLQRLRGLDGGLYHSQLF